MEEKVLLEIELGKLKRGPQIIIDEENGIKINVIGNHFPVQHLDYKPNLQGVKRSIKKPLSTSELVSKLRNSGVEMSEQEVSRAYEMLYEINYYRACYFKQFLSNEYTFSRLEELYNFDRFLRMRMMTLVYPIEEFLRTTLANHFVCKYRDPLIYTDISIYRYSEEKRKREYDKLQNKMYEGVYHNIKTDRSLQHHLVSYGGNIPMWVLLEHAEFGVITDFFSLLATKERKEYIAEKVESKSDMKIGDKFFSKWINVIRMVRNKCAHMSFLYGSTLNFPLDLSTNPIFDQLCRSSRYSSPS